MYEDARRLQDRAFVVVVVAILACYAVEFLFGGGFVWLGHALFASLAVSEVCFQLYERIWLPKEQWVQLDGRHHARR